MTHKNFSFWFCTLLSGVVIGIASQRIPEASANLEAFKQHPSAPYYDYADQNPLSSKPISAFQIHGSGYSLAYDAHYHNRKESIQSNIDRSSLGFQVR